MLVRSVFCLCLASSLLASDLPKGIKKCKFDGSLNECVKKEAKEAIKNLVKGDKEFKIPVADPFYVEQIAVIDGPKKSISLNFTLNKLYIHGLTNTELVRSNIDFKKRKIEWDFKIKELKFLSDYEISGKFLLVPITGKGKSIITIVEPEVTYSYDFTEKEKGGKKYMVIGKTDLKYKPKKITMNFENLFNGDKTLGSNLNQMLNENWEEMNNQVGPSFGEVFKQIITNIIDKIVKATPIDRLFLE